MILDPADGVGGNLAFMPQLYDRWERQVVEYLLPTGGVFVDAGANVGAYSLWAAKKVGERGRVLAYEAEPSNFAALVENIRINGLDTIVTAQNVGVADTTGDLELQLNDGGNSGGHSFVGAKLGDCNSISIACEPLAVLLKRAAVDRVDFMKLDIEGFEQRVLARFFSDIPESSSLRPRCVLAEMYFGDERDQALLATMEQAGYVLRGSEGLNCLFVRGSGE